MNETPKGNVLAIDTGTTTTNVGYYKDGVTVFEQRITHAAHELAQFANVMDQDQMRREAILDVLEKREINPLDIDIIMARGGLFAPVRTGVYKVNRDMRDVLMTCRDGVHACNLSAVVADELAYLINEVRNDQKISSPFGLCQAYIADPPMADEMLPECRIGGLPEFPRRAFFHALNSRAAVKEYLKKISHKENDITAIVAHLGNGITVTLHKNGEVIDTNNGLGGDGPFTQERAGTCPAFPLVEMCFSGKYTESDIKKKILGGGGAVAYFGTNDMEELSKKAKEGDEDCEVFLKAFCLNVAKYIAGISATVDGRVDVIILTGNNALIPDICEGISKKISFIAPVEVIAGEHALVSLAENGYNVLSSSVKIHRYDKNAIVPDGE